MTLSDSRGHFNDFFSNSVNPIPERQYQLGFPHIRQMPI